MPLHHAAPHRTDQRRTSDAPAIHGLEGEAAQFGHEIGQIADMRTFVLAEGIEVLGASLQDGLLSVDLAKPLAGRVARRIEIDGRG